MLGGAERYLERVIFGQKSPCLSLRLSGVQWRIVCLQYVTQVAVISDWYGSNGSMRVRGYVRHLAFGDRGHPKCAMGSKQSLEEVLFGLKSPCLRVVQRHILGLQCHPSDCNFYL